MKKNIIIAIALLSVTLSGGCGNNNNAQESDSAVDVTVEEDTEESSEIVTETLPEEPTEEEPESDETDKQNQDTAELADGIYTAEFTTDSSMFRVNETCEGKGTLTVENGEMTIHITLGSKKILNLYPGLAEDASEEGTELLLPTEDTVTYSDGMTEEVYGFDVPVPMLETEFDLALIGTKGNGTIIRSASPIRFRLRMMKYLWKMVHIAWELPLQAEAERQKFCLPYR